MSAERRSRPWRVLRMLLGNHAYLWRGGLVWLAMDAALFLSVFVSRLGCGAEMFAKHEFGERTYCDSGQIGGRFRLVGVKSLFSNEGVRVSWAPGDSEKWRPVIELYGEGDMSPDEVRLWPDRDGIALVAGDTSIALSPKEWLFLLGRPHPWIVTGLPWPSSVRG